jgi:hypothetical protein
VVGVKEVGQTSSSRGETSTRKAKVEREVEGNERDALGEVIMRVCDTSNPRTPKDNTMTKPTRARGRPPKHGSTRFKSAQWESILIHLGPSIAQPLSLKSVSKLNTSQYYSEIQS